MVTTSQLIAFMAGRAADSTFIDRLKIVYRPHICPFDDLINEIDGQQPRVMDIGCGSGQFCLLLAEFSSAKSLNGIEVSQHLIDNANSLLSEYKTKLDCNFHVYNGKDIPEELGTCDTIFLIDVLHHVPQQQQVAFLENIYSKMSKGSVLLLKDINAASPFVIFNKIHDAVFSREIGHELSVKAVTEIATRIGFTIESVTTKTLYVYPHYFFRLRK